MSFTVREYLDERGRSPFREWLTSLDTTTRARIQARVLRFESGNLGDHEDIRKDIKCAKELWDKYVKETKHGKA